MARMKSTELRRKPDADGTKKDGDDKESASASASAEGNIESSGNQVDNTQGSTSRETLSRASATASEKTKATKAMRKELRERERLERENSGRGGAIDSQAKSAAVKGKEPQEKDSGRAANKVGKAAAMAAATAASNKAENSDDERVWVQCNDCDKWRSLPPTVKTEELPDIWVCSMNAYDADRDHCDAPEEHYKLPEEENHVPLKSWCKLWTKRLKSADRAENRLSTAAVTRGNKKRKLDSEWIRCSNPSCGKWRAISRGIDSSTLLKRLHKGRQQQHLLVGSGSSGVSNGLWFCSMNNWDETTASCAAPQEPLWNCKWNLQSR